MPIVAIETADPAQTKRITGADIPGECPIFEWDCVRGIRALNKAAESIQGKVFPAENEDERRAATSNPVELLNMLRKYDKNDAEKYLPPNSYIYMHNMQRFSQETFVMQAIANLRDFFKGRGSMLVLLYTVVQLPDELGQDIVTISDPLPDRKQIEKIIDSVLSDASAKKPDDKERLIELSTGLAAFPTEQTIALSLEKKDGAIVVNTDVLWDTKCNAIRQTPGLKVHEGPESFATLGGCTNAKEFFIRLKDSPDRPSAIMLIDEIEKQMGGATGPIGDSSGTSQDQLGVLLTMMQDYGISGWLEFGPAGAAKTAFAKALTAELGIPLLMCDLGAMKASLVGESERKIRQAMKVFLSVSNGKGMIIGTCNKYIQLPPELRRRFNNGMWFFDLPTPEEQETIWPIYLKKYKLKEKPKFKFDGWTGAEIKTCAETAWRFSMSLEEASRFIVPVARQAADIIGQMRTQADGKFISASTRGFYKIPSTQSAEDEGGRKMEL